MRYPRNALSNRCATGQENAAADAKRMKEHPYSGVRSNPAHPAAAWNAPHHRMAPRLRRIGETARFI